MLSAKGLKTTHIIRSGENLFDVICESLVANNAEVRERSIIVIAETLVGTTQNRIISLANISDISPQAEKYASDFELEPQFAQLVYQEADEIIGGIPGMLFTVKDGVLIANGGVDKSNAGERDEYSLWPENPFGVALDLCQKFKDKFGLREFGIIISDSRVQPLRRGIVGVAIGVAGFQPIDDCRGRCDLFGHEMKWTTRGVADQLTDMAHLLMGECDEQTPFILIHDAPVVFTAEAIDPKAMLMPKDEDLFSRILNF
ncbi:MAG: coenzyme F420-0:L-glutamate ligase [Promethearchaeota archaeon]